ncbi:MAG: HNH endonuclease [Thermomicrobia bacterium]|nr:HNH endonuclease [Thermomicrobia bacterium]MCA1722757.1 HNH endonuclease [Thermomicrobia bacterium]
MPCRQETRHPQDYCPDCGAPIQRHVARCRQCTARARIVRAAEDVTYGPEWQGQRARALKRANETCGKCGAQKKPGAKIHIHHIIPWRVTHDSGDVNLAALCHPCHGEVHRRYYRARCETPESFRVVFALFLLGYYARKIGEGEVPAQLHLF